MNKLSQKELDKLPKADRIITCLKCGKNHAIMHNTRISDVDGSEICDESMGFVHCSDGKTYLASIHGKLVNLGGIK